MKIFKQLGILCLSSILILSSCGKKDDNPDNPSLEGLAKEEKPLEAIQKMDLQGQDIAKTEEQAKQLQLNPNVEKAIISPDGSLLVKEKGDKVMSVFPTVSTLSFEDYKTTPSHSLSGRLTQRFTSRGESGRVAIFNYFSDIGERKGQNKIVDNMIVMFEKHNYSVDYYPYEHFTSENIKNVVANSKKYAAVIIMSHGFIAKTSGKEIAYYALGEEYDLNYFKEQALERSYNPFASPAEQKYESAHYSWYYRIWAGKTYNKVAEVKALGTDKNCILYVGACQAFRPGLSTMYANEPQTYIGWDGVNKLSQAHAALVFNAMLTADLTLGQIKESGYPFKNDETGANVVIECSQASNLKLKGNKDILPKYDDNYGVALRDHLNDNKNVFYKTTFFSHKFKISGRLFVEKEGVKLSYIYAAFEPMDSGQKTYFYKIKIDKKKGGYFEKDISLDNSMRGIYNLSFSTQKNLITNTIKPINNSYKWSFIYSEKFKENFAQALPAFEGNGVSLVDNSDNLVSSVELFIGSNTEQITIDEYENDEYSVQSSDPSVATASLQGMKINLKGIKEGTCKLIVNNRTLNTKTEIDLKVGNIQIPDGVVIENGVLKKWPCDKIPDDGKVVIPNTVTEIGERAFEGCSELSVVEIPNSVNKIGQAAFRNCKALKSITIPSNVETIESYAFYGCSALTSVTIANGVRNIRDYVFTYCSSLTKIVVPDSVRNMGTYVFEGCSALESAKLSENVATIPRGTFADCYSLKNVEFSSSLTSVQDYAFVSCKSLTTITFPKTISHISSYYSFSGCTNLKTANIKATAPFSVATILYNTNATVYVPEVSLETYQNNHSNDYKDRIKALK
ncbi:leucine-rich repeat domain-containing protein [Capnocytophaga bilenii]